MDGGSLKAAAFNVLYSLGVHTALRNIKPKQNQITVLCLHRISAEYDYFWDPIKPEDFDFLIRYLIRHYDVISIEQATNVRTAKRPKVILSFDDGYYDFYANALPVLKHYSLPANHNIVTDIVNGIQDMIWTEKLNFLFNYLKQNEPDELLNVEDAEFKLKHEYHNLDKFYITILKKLFNLKHEERQLVLNTWVKKFGLKIVPKKMMGWNEIRQCANNGVTFGSHTKTHDALTSIKSPDAVFREYSESKAEIEKNLKVEVTALAPPNGLCNDEVIRQAELAGYKYVLGIGDHSFVKPVNSNITFLSRLNLISEPQRHMVLRVEELQSKLRKYGRV